MAETLVCRLFADVERRGDFGPGGALLAADLYHFRDALGHDHFQGVEPPQDMQFPDPAVDRSVRGDVQFEPPDRIDR